MSLRLFSRFFSKNNDEREIKRGSGTVSVAEFLSRDSDLSVRLLLAQNPSAPIDILKRLSMDSERIVRGAVARNSNASASLLEEIYRRDSMIYPASNPNTPAWILSEMADDGICLMELSRNPSTPPAVLETLSASNPSDVASNINAPASLLERLSLSGVGGLSSGDDDSDRYIRMSVADNPGAPSTVVDRLAYDSDHLVSYCAKKNPNISANVLEDLYYELSEMIERVSVLANEGKGYQADELAYDASDLAGAIGSNPTTSPTMLHDLIALSDEMALRHIANNPALSVEDSRLLRLNDNSQIRLAIASNVNVCGDVLASLSSDSDFEVRSAVAKNANTPENVIRELAEDEDECVYAAVASNVVTPPDLLRQMVLDDYGDTIKSVVAANPNTPIELLAALYEEGAMVRAKLAANPNIQNIYTEIKIPF